MIKKYLYFIPLIALFITVAGCANSNTIFAKEDDQYKVERGIGGEFEVVDGIEIWTPGGPDKDYQILGEILDSRSGGLIHKVGMNSEIAKKAKEVGGDAVIKRSSSVRRYGPVTKTMTWNTLPSGAGYPTYSTHQNARRESRFIVIKYLNTDDEQYEN